MGPSGIVATDCAGDILLEDVNYYGNGVPNSYVHFERCHNVVLRGCEFALSGYPIKVIDSTMLMTTTAVYHDPPYGGAFSFWAYQQTTEGIRLANSTVTIVNSSVRGNNHYGNNVWIARPAAVIESGTLRLGPFASLRGGLIPQFPYQAEGYAILGAGTVEKDFRATISQPVLSPNPPVLVDRSAVFHDWLVGNGTFRVSVAGPPGGCALLALADMTPFPQVTPLGTLALDPFTLTTIGFATLPPPNGWYEWTLFCPSAAAVAHAFVFQAMTISPSGVLSLTLPSPFTVGWPAGQIP
ncbi:MAG: right-handed parallel beta-helix repeat-containing protein [Planctomycetota bacterium]